MRNVYVICFVNPVSFQMLFWTMNPQRNLDITLRLLAQSQPGWLVKDLESSMGLGYKSSKSTINTDVFFVKLWKITCVKNLKMELMECCLEKTFKKTGQCWVSLLKMIPPRTEAAGTNGEFSWQKSAKNQRLREPYGATIPRNRMSAATMIFTFQVWGSLLYNRWIPTFCWASQITSLIKYWKKHTFLQQLPLFYL